MYESYFGLEKAPFTLSPDPRFLYAAPRTREAFAGVLHGVLDRRGFVVLTGESGTGKSTLLRAVLSEISPERLASSLIFNPLVKPEEFLELAMLDFGISDIPDSKPRRLARFNDFLIENHRQGRINVLIIDEAHTLTPALLEEIRLLTNFESSDTKLLQIVLSGHTELDDMLERFELRQLKQRIAIRTALRPLHSSAEVGAYILHRWRKAGAKADLPFHPGAIAAIAHFSQGIPRTINSLCDNSLLLAYGSSKRLVDRAMVIEVACEMRLIPHLQGLPAGAAGEPVAQRGMQAAATPAQIAAPARAAAAAPGGMSGRSAAMNPGSPASLAVRLAMEAADLVSGPGGPAFGMPAGVVPSSGRMAVIIEDEDLFPENGAASSSPNPVVPAAKPVAAPKPPPAVKPLPAEAPATEPSEPARDASLIGQWAAKFRKTSSSTPSKS